MLRPSTDGFIGRLRDAFFERSPDSFNGTLLTSSTSENVTAIKVFQSVSNVKEWRCDYEYIEERSPSTSEESDSFQEKYFSVHSATSIPNPYTLPPSNFPALYFVDPSVFDNHHVDLPRATEILPSYVVGELGSDQQHEYIGRLFFHTIHAWFPIVSRKRFYDELHESAEGLGTAADLGFLLLSMKLITWRPPSSEGDVPVEGQTARAATYRAAKQFSFELEASGLISLRFLQGMLLVALYEIGHAIYPAAFMSVAACVRYAQGLGIQPGGKQRLKLPLTWVEKEERKRIWWSAFLLDRLSCPGCPAAIDEPGPDESLPVDDTRWDEGAASVPCSPLLNSPVSNEFGRFALLIQAFVLLSKVLRLTSNMRAAQPKLQGVEARQLERTVKALLYFGLMERKWRNGVTSCELHSVSQISLLAMYTSSMIPVKMPDKFVESLADVLDNSNYKRLVTAARRGRDEISPFLIQLLYQTSVLLLKGERPTNGDWSGTRVERLKEALMWLDKRWQLAAPVYAFLITSPAIMSNKGESLILPSNAVFLVHKVGTSKAGSETQWETRSKPMRAAPDPTPRTSTAKSANNNVKPKSDVAEGGSWEFVSYTPRKAQQLPKRPKESKRRRRNEGAAVSSKNQPVVAVKQQPKLSPNPSFISPDLPVALVGHALLYINYYFHSIAAGAYTLPCLRFNPAKRDWFPRMMQDEAWRCIILSLSASLLASVTGSSSNYVDSHTLLDEALRQLKGRIASGGLASDQTLGAIACLSMWSNELGNYDKAWIHAKGLAELVKLRGGFSKISDGMRSKVYRGVYDIAVDVDKPPLLDDGLRDSPSREIIHDDHFQLEEHEVALSGCRISSRLSSIYRDILQLSATVDDAMAQNLKLDTISFYETVFGFYNRLLTCQSDKLSSCDDSLRISLILYIKSIISHDRLNMTSMNLVRKLQTSLQGCLHSSAPLTRWKLFIGGMAATDETTEQQWFLQQLATATAQRNMIGEDGWKSLQAELSNVLWSGPIHDTTGYKLWLRIEGTRPT
ncbi:hypothetical protein V8C35DRAFT_322578 [Trichoderma chlorosporum]